MDAPGAPEDRWAHGSSGAPGASDPAEPVELIRDNERGLITGVCAGLGAYTRVDPIVWRMAFAVTGLAGLTGLLLYIGAWMAMRDPNRGPAMFEQLLNRRIDERAVVALLGLGLAIAAALSLVGGVRWGTLMLATPLILGLLVAHNRGVDLRRTYRELPGLLKSAEPPPATPEPEPKPAYYNPAQPWAQAPAGPVDLAVVARITAGRSAAPARDAGEDDDGDTDGPDADEHDGHDRRGRRGSRRQRRAERRARRGTRLTGFALPAIVAATGITLGVTEAPVQEALLGPETGPLYLGSVVVIIGVALLLGTWFGDPRGLIVLGVAATALLVLSAAVDLTGQRFGAEEWRPRSVADVRQGYTLTVGVAELDLTELPLEPGQRVDVDATVRYGRLEVLVPEYARVEVRGDAAFGEVRVDGSTQSGTGVRLRRVLEPVAPPEGAAAPAGGARGTGGAGNTEGAEGTEGAGGADNGASPAGGRGGEGGGADEAAPTLVLDLDSRFGELEVRRVAA
ncbi:PspC domain-containing protein [Streptomonospora nanhaiensis]|uniref:Phage shock protein PspC (Stress-responsive transcriptional regulator) n=1 Tax=Streptomonospora nanhaiensis TaxID=1323731 RepID=A0A853BPP2_9ACTN|nr:PspC domain-containing protein [Streptomonospora nanhaiensis]NYI97629.1 phage shock protein PspC (stress-responsive transcriptional regulator) [Streptomonospora nanhaiensis]